MNNRIVSEIENKHLTAVKLNDGIVTNKVVVGSFVKNSGEIEVINLNHQYDNLKGKYLDIQGFGKWYVNDLSTDEEFTTSKLSLYDISNKFDDDYEDTFPFPDTMGNWATWIGNKVGIPLKGDFLNSDLILTKKPYLGSNPKYRDAVKKIALYASSYARKNYDNTYSICWFENDLTNIEDWESFVHGNTTNSINVLVLSTGDTEDNVKYPEEIPTNTNELRIEDEWTDIDRYSINEAIYNQVNGFFYTPISKLNVPFGLLELRAGQKIKTQDIEHQNIETYISKVTLEWQGGEFDDTNAWTTSIQMEELKETSTKLEFADSKKNKFLQVERLANKTEGLIQDTITQIEGNNQKMTSLEMSVNEVNISLSNKVDNQELTGANIMLLINNDTSEANIKADKLKLEGYTTINNGFSVDLDGTASMNGATIKGGNIELVDEGNDSNPSVLIYDKNSYTEENITRISNNINLSEMTLHFNKEYIDEWFNYINGTNSEIIASDKYSLYANAYDKYTEDGLHHIGIIREIKFSNGDIIYQKYYNLDDECTILKDLIESYKLPKDFGIVKRGQYFGDTIYSDFISKATKKVIKNYTSFNSAGVIIEDKDEGISTSYSSNGLYVKDSVGSSYLKSDEISIQNNYGSDFYEFDAVKDCLLFQRSGTQLLVDTSSNDRNNDNLIFKINGNEYLKVSTGGIVTTTLIQNSLFEKKKNINKLNSVLDKVLEADICEFNFKNEEDDIKKHLGLVIGSNYNTPVEVISQNGDGIDTYSMVAMAWKSIQELNRKHSNKIAELEQRIKELEIKEVNHERCISKNI